MMGSKASSFLIGLHFRGEMPTMGLKFFKKLPHITEAVILEKK